MIASFFMRVILLQAIVISLIIWVLKKILDRSLIDLAVRQFKLRQRQGQKSVCKNIRIISHKGLSSRNRSMITCVVQQALGADVSPGFEVDKALWGGLKILVGDEEIDCSLRDRLRQALEPMSLDVNEPEPIVAFRRDELRAMLDVIDAAEQVHEYGFDCHGNLEDALARFREVSG